MQIPYISKVSTVLPYIIYIFFMVTDNLPSAPVFGGILMVTGMSPADQLKFCLYHIPAITFDIIGTLSLASNHILGYHTAAI